MRTLLISLACVALVGCAKPVPPGMEKMGSTDEFKRNSGNSTQVGETYDAARSDVANTLEWAVEKSILDAIDMVTR